MPASDSLPNHLCLTLSFRSFRGAHTLVRFAAPNSDAPELEFELPGLHAHLRPGDRVDLRLDPNAIVPLAPS